MLQYNTPDSMVLLTILVSRNGACEALSTSGLKRSTKHIVDLNGQGRHYPLEFCRCEFALDAPKRASVVRRRRLSHLSLAAIRADRWRVESVIRPRQLGLLHPVQRATGVARQPRPQLQRVDPVYADGEGTSNLDRWRVLTYSLLPLGR